MADIAEQKRVRTAGGEQGERRGEFERRRAEGGEDAEAQRGGIHGDVELQGHPAAPVLELEQGPRDAARRTRDDGLHGERRPRNGDGNGRASGCRRPAALVIGPGRLGGGVRDTSGQQREREQSKARHKPMMVARFGGRGAACYNARWLPEEETECE